MNYLHGFCVVRLRSNESVFCSKRKTAYEMRISDWSSDVCSSDLYAVDGYVSIVAVAAIWAGVGKALQFRAAETPASANPIAPPAVDREERRVGKECVSTCRSRRSP